MPSGRGKKWNRQFDFAASTFCAQGLRLAAKRGSEMLLLHDRKSTVVNFAIVQRPKHSGLGVLRKTWVIDRGLDGI